MKTILKSLFVAAVFMGMGSTVQAQTIIDGTSGSIEVAAKVLRIIQIANEAPVNFGATQLGNGLSSLSTASLSASTNVGFSAKPGRLVVTATQEEPVRMEFDLITALSHDNASITDKIYFIPEVYGIQGVVTDDFNSLAKPLSNLPEVTDFSKVTADESANSSIPTGRGPFVLFNTLDEPFASGGDRATLYIGGIITTQTDPTAWDGYDPDNNAGTPLEIDNVVTGRYSGTVNINFIYNF
jgi:hypothetical protein